MKKTGDELKTAEEMFKVLANSTRLEILQSLKDGEKSVKDIAETTGQDISNISHHLRRLRDKRLIGYRKEGRKRYYSIKDNHVLKMLKGNIEHARE